MTVRPTRPPGRLPGRQRQRGFTALETLLSVALLSVLVGIAVPLSGDVVDELRTAGAARHMAARIGRARMDAIRRATAVGFRFQTGSVDYSFRAYVDGNGNGVRTLDIQRGIDEPDGTAAQIADNFPGIRFELRPDLPDLDGVRDGRTDGVRIGAARILTMSPDGTATSGTLYLRGRRSQYAVRVLGATGRTRVLTYLSGDGTWISR
jgi:prepilin-type N-terminal cleavage/methylation domain-containing protein